MPAIIREMRTDYESWQKNDPRGRVKFDFVAIPKNKDGKGWSEAEALKLASMDTYALDWDGGLRLSGFWEDVRASMERAHTETFPDADPMDDAPLPVVVPSEMKSHAVAMTGRRAETMSEPHPINIHPRHYYWKAEAREGYWNYDPAKREVGPLGEMHVRAFIQACENQLNNPDIGTDKPGGHLFIKKHKKNHDKLASLVGRQVKWELRVAEAS